MTSENSKTNLRIPWFMDGLFLDKLSHCQILLVIRRFENIYTEPAL